MVQDDFPKNENGRKNQNSKSIKYMQLGSYIQKVINQIIESLQMEFSKKVTTTTTTEKHEVKIRKLIDIIGKVFKKSGHVTLGRSIA